MVMLCPKRRRRNTVLSPEVYLFFRPATTLRNHVSSGSNKRRLVAGKQKHVAGDQVRTLTIGGPLSRDGDLSFVPAPWRITLDRLTDMCFDLPRRNPNCSISLQGNSL